MASEVDGHPCRSAAWGSQVGVIKRLVSLGSRNTGAIASMFPMPPMALQGEVFFVKISSRGSQVEVSNVEDFASRLLTRQGALKPMVHSRWGSSMSSEAKGS